MNDLSTGDIFDRRPELQDLIFLPSGMTGNEMKALGKARVQKWLEFRERFGFSEFNSDTYGPYSYNSLLALVGLAPDVDIQKRARMIARAFDFTEN